MADLKKVDNFTQGCTCDACGKELTAQVIWIWEEHFACTRECATKCYYDARPELKPQPEVVP